MGGVDADAGLSAPGEGGYIDTSGGSSGSSSDVGSAAWYAAEISSREATAAATTESSPGTANLGGGDVSGAGGGGTYTDPRTGMVFATEAIARALGYAPSSPPPEGSVGGSPPAGYIGGIFNPVTGETTGGYPSQRQMESDRASAGTNIGGPNYDQIVAMQTPFDSATPYLNVGVPYVAVTPQTLTRPDYRAPSTLGDKATQELVKTGLTYEQALFAQQQMASTPSQKAYFEMELRSALISNLAVSSERHYQSYMSGLATGPNPFEYTADLSLVALGKGSFERYGSFKLSDIETVAKAKTSGDVGPYNTRNLHSYSSALNRDLTLSEQQYIGKLVASTRPDLVIDETRFEKLPMPKDFGYGGRDYVSSVQISEAPQVREQPLSLGTFGGMNIVSLEKAGKPESMTTTEKPSEDWIRGVPFIGRYLANTGIFKKTSDVMNLSAVTPEEKYHLGALKFVITSIAPTEIATTIVSQPRDILRSELPMDTSGATYTPMFVDPVTGKKSQIWEEKIGEEYIEGGQAYQKYLIHDLSMVSVQTAQTFVTEGKSPYVKWEQGLTSWMPPAEVGEAAVRKVSLTNPIIAPGIVAGYVSEYMTDVFMPSRSQEIREQNIMVEGIVGLRGQYTTFKESPTMSISSFGVGLVLGGVTKGAATAYPHILKASGSGLTGKVLATTVKYAPYALVGMYGADVVGRGTDYGTSIDYRTPGRIKGIIVQEAVPMGLGMMVGYAPIRTAKGAYNRVDAKLWEYRQAAAGVYQGQGTGPIWEEPVFTGSGGRPTPPPTPGGYTPGGRTGGYTTPPGGRTTGGSTAPLRPDGTVSPARIFKDTIEGGVAGDKFAQYEAAYKMRTYSETYARTGNVKFKDYANLYSGLRPKGDIINPYTGAVEYRAGARGGMEYFPSAPKASTMAQAPKSNMIPREAFEGIQTSNGRGMRLVAVEADIRPGDPFTVRYTGGKYGIQPGTKPTTMPTTTIIPREKIIPEDVRGVMVPPESRLVTAVSYGGGKPPIETTTAEAWNNADLAENYVEGTDASYLIGKHYITVNSRNQRTYVHELKEVPITQIERTSEDLLDKKPIYKGLTTQAPPVDVTRLENEKYRLFNGHRRLQSAIARGDKKIFVEEIVPRNDVTLKDDIKSQAKPGGLTLYDVRDGLVPYDGRRGLTTRQPGKLTQYKKSPALERVTPGGLKLYEPGGKIALPQRGGALTSYGKPGGLITTPKGALTITEPGGKLKVMERPPPPRVIERPPPPRVIERPIPDPIIPKPIITVPGIPKFGDLGGGGGASGGGKRGKRQFREIFNIGLDLSTFGKDAYNWGGGPKGGAARKTAGSAKRTPLKQLVKRVTGAKKGGKKK